MSIKFNCKLFLQFFILFLKFFYTSAVIYFGRRTGVFFMVNVNTSGVKNSPKLAKDEEIIVNNRKEGKYVIKSGETLSSLAKKFNLTVDEVKKYAGLPTVSVKSGQGLISLAKENGMTFAKFCELNGINENYKPQKDEKFFVSAKSEPQKTEAKKAEKKKVEPKKAETEKPEQKAVSDKKPVSETTKNVKPKETPKPISEKNKEYANEIKTADDIANALYKSANITAAVGKEKFTIPFDKIDENNVIAVIKKYDDIDKKMFEPDTLIGMIADEWGNSKKTRMNYITALYDKVAQASGNLATEEHRQAFLAELQNQFDSWGRVSTGKLDEMINELIFPKQEDLSSPSPEYLKRVVKLDKEQTRTVKQLRKEAEASSQKERPYPMVDNAGNITAEVQYFKSSSNGKLRGKTVIVNSGHGGYRNTGAFDPGTLSGNEEEAPKNKLIADEVIKKLQNEGANVIFLRGYASSIMDAKEKYNYADLFLSIHCDSSPKSDISGQRIIFRDNQDKTLAQNIESQMDEMSEINAGNCKIKADDRDLGVLRACDKMPSIIIETGFQSNKNDLDKINSKSFRKNLADSITNGVVNYFKDET